MIRKLHIKNYAIIGEIEIDFHEQLTVMTGETGAGKSIILEALSLILGDRADNSVILDENTKCVVEGSFDIKNNKKIKEKLSEKDFDDDNDLLILRREINPQGKSRAFINDTPCTLSDLIYINNSLVDVNKQFDNQHVKSDDYVIGWIDVYAENGAIATRYSRKYKEYSDWHKQLKRLQDQKADMDKERDYILFQMQEIRDMGLKEDEIESLEEEIRLIENQSYISKLEQESLYILSESEGNILQMLHRIQGNLSQLSQFNSRYVALQERVFSVIEEVKDVSSEVSDNNINIEITESEFEEKNQRYSDAQRLLKKHHLTSTRDLLLLLDELEMRNKGFDNLDNEILDIENHIKIIQSDLAELSQQLSERRQAAVLDMLPALMDILQKLGLDSAQVKLDVMPVNKLFSTGCDEVYFMVDFNKTNQFLPLSKAGSGGELSRMLLAMKSIIGDKHDDTTFIFDEIDSAISGEVARQVAFLIKTISHKNQVIVLTHQPQMASKGDRHYHLYKEYNEHTQRNQTFIRQLNDEERINYIAQMMGGDEVSESTLNSAREMIKNK